MKSCMSCANIVFDNSDITNVAVVRCGRDLWTWSAIENKTLAACVIAGKDCPMWHFRIESLGERKHSPL